MGQLSTTSLILFSIVASVIFLLNFINAEDVISAPNINTSPDLLQILQDELQEFKMGMTRSFIAQHGRRKREILKYSYDASLKYEDVFNAPTISIRDGTYSSCTFRNETIIFQRDGIYCLEGLSTSIPSIGAPNLVKLTSWTLDGGEVVLAATEWDGILFILTKLSNGNYSKLYTVHGLSNTLTPRQQIRNQGYATAASFFIHSYDLYLTITNDNTAHSLTTSPIYRWTRTYMDQIHEIQTRGAVSVVSFPVSSSTYIAIAQAEDAAGNFEVGTLVVRVFGKGELEKVQLLWSIEPVSLSYVRFLEEHFLVIGQKREATICYWFGGYQFVYWQSLEDLQGNSVLLDSLVLPDREPLLLGGTESTLSLYSRSQNSHLRETSMLNRSSVLYTARGSERIIEARFIKYKLDSIYLALTVESSGSATLRIFPLKLSKISHGEDRLDPDDKIGRCMKSLKQALDDDEPYLEYMQANMGDLLLRSRNEVVKANLIVHDAPIRIPEYSELGVVSITPNLQNPEDKYEFPPSQTLNYIEKELIYLDYFEKEELSHVLRKSKPGVISGHLTFTHGLNVQYMQLTSPLLLDTLNGIPWSVLEHGVLRNDKRKRQIVTGNWDIDTLKADLAKTGPYIGGISISDFLLTKCEERDTQIILGNQGFQDVEVESLTFGHGATINGIPFDEIALRSHKNNDIRGFKDVHGVVGGKNVDVELINGLRLSEWYDAVLKTGGVSEESSDASLIFTGYLAVKNLYVQRINGRNWDEFVNSVLLDGKDQIIQGDLRFSKLNVGSLHVKTINGAYVDDWMTTSTNQFVRSQLEIGELKCRENVVTDTVNGIHISDAVIRAETDVKISGPVKLSRFTVRDVTVAPYITINSVDISEAVKFRKQHIYTTLNGEGLFFDGNVQVDELYAPSLNGIQFDSIRESYWLNNSENTIPSDFNFGSSKVSVSNRFDTGTLNGLNVEMDVVSTTGNHEIRGDIYFTSDVVATGSVITPDGVTLNGYDFSQLEKGIVRVNDGQRHIRGRKEFVDIIEANGGIRVKTINGVTLEDELVWLNGYGKQRLTGEKSFYSIVANDVTTKIDVGLQAKLNGIDLRELDAYTVRDDVDGIVLDSDIVIEGNVDADDIHIKQHYNELKVGEILANLIRLDSNQNLTTSLIISGNVEFLGNVEVNFINGISPISYLSQIADRNEDEVIHGRKDFLHVTVEGDLHCDTINDLNLADLELYALSKTADQVVKGKLTFQELHIEGNLDTRKISGIPTNYFARVDRNNQIEGDVVLTSAEVKVDGDISVKGLVNNYRIEDVVDYLTKMSGDRKFHNVYVAGNVSWENSDLSLHRISHLFENGVGIDTDQYIRGKVTFKDGVRMESLETEKWVNGVDIAYLISDSVNPHSPVHFRGANVFAEDIQVTRGSVLISGHLDTATINGINLKDLYAQVVPINSTRQIRGKKLFLKGLETSDLNVNGDIAGIYPHELITIANDRLIDHVAFTDLLILNDLNFRLLNGYNLDDLLYERVTLDGAQEISGDITIAGDVSVEECHALSINGQLLSDIFHKASSTPVHITGAKTFKNLRIVGNIEGVTINGIDLAEVWGQLLGLNRDEVINRHVIFTDKIHLLQDIEVTGDVNDFALDHVATNFTARLDALVSNALVSNERKEAATMLIEHLKNSERGKPVWLDYVEEVRGFGGKRTRVETFIDPSDSAEVIFAFHYPHVDNRGKLPSGCVCNSIGFLHYTQPHSLSFYDELGCVTIFDVATHNGQTYTLYSNVLSYNKTCTGREVGSTYISTSTDRIGRYQAKDWDQYVRTERSLQRIPESGFVSDVKAFSHQSANYLVIAQSYNPSRVSHEADVVVYEEYGDQFTKVQSIQSNGAIRLALDFVNNVWTLVIANRGAESLESCPTKSGIYIWSASAKEFLLLREVPTGEIVDVALLSIQKYGEFHGGYAVFAQNEGDFGKVDIFQYDKENENYYPYQSLSYDNPVGAVASLSIPEFSYLIVVIPSRGLDFYKYSHAEGFKLEFTSMGMEGVQDVSGILVAENIFFPIAAFDDNKGAILTQGILKGRLSGNSYYY